MKTPPARASIEPVATALHRIQGRLVVRMEPGVRARPGMPLADASGRDVGRISDLFGPVRRPYGVLYPRGEVRPGPLYESRRTERAPQYGYTGREHAETAARTGRRTRA